MARAIALFIAFTGGAHADITIASFDGAKGTTLTWKETDDPVMGGKSKGTFTVDSDNKVGIFSGTCAIVPFLKAPGFIKVVSSGTTPDVSTCKNLVLNVKSQTDYKGFKVSFSNDQYPGGKFFAYGYKADFQPPVGKFGDVVLPFTSFSSHWDDGTGEPITKCAGDSKACPTVASLKDMKTISFWGEGVAGDVNLQIKSIRASGCDEAVESSAGVTLATFDGAEGTTFKFVELNDPVMGGKSTGTFKIDAENKVGVFDGEVVNVPSLKAPGFIKVAGDATYFPDASSVGDKGDVVLSVRSSQPDYKGYRVTIVSGASSAAYACSGGGTLPFSRGCYKAKFSVPNSTNGEFHSIRIPLSSFSDLWSPASGEHNKECADDSSACLTPQRLSKVQRLELWAEGMAGKANLQISKISVEADAVAVVLV
jgi:hypothetical protein